jgi:flagellar biogenesis protein FliO
MALELIKTLVALAAVLGLMFLVVLLMKRYFLSGPHSASEVVEIEVLSQKSLQPKRQLLVVKVLNKVMVLSSTEHGIQAVGEIDDEAVIHSIEQRQGELRSEKSSSFSGFKQKLYQAETLGELFHKPFNVILWRGDKTGIASSSEVQAEPRS